MPGGTTLGAVLGIHVPIGWVHVAGESALSIGGELVMQFPLM